jgi:hypothetical protein
MRRSHSFSPTRRAIAALCEPDGYVDALLGLARSRAGARRSRGIVLAKPSRQDPRNLHFAEPQRKWA